MAKQGIKIDHIRVAKTSGYNSSNSSVVTTIFGKSGTEKIEIAFDKEKLVRCVLGNPKAPHNDELIHNMESVYSSVRDLQFTSGKEEACFIIEEIEYRLNKALNAHTILHDNKAEIMWGNGNAR